MIPSDNIAIIKNTVNIIRDDVKEIKENLKVQDVRLRLVEVQSASNRVRVEILSLMAASIGVIAAAVAGWLGTR